MTKAKWKKMRKAFCPPKEVRNNPVLEIAKHHVFRWGGEVKVGPFEITSYDRLKELYIKGKIHPADLKESLAEELSNILEPVRKFK